MRGYVEVRAGAAPELFPITGERTTIGRAPTNGIPVPHPTVSQVHAVVEAYGGSFAVRDLGSSNGTFVNGEPLVGERRLRSGDDIRLGEAHVVFRSQGVDDTAATVGSDGPPDLTRRERDVLVALCRPMVGRQPFTQPAGIRQLAAELVVSDAAVKFHLANLYDKFDIRDAGESRRVQLANEAIRRRAVSYADLRGAGLTDGRRGRA